MKTSQTTMWTVVMITVACLLGGASECDDFELNPELEELFKDLLDCDPGEGQVCQCQDGRDGYQVCSPEGGTWNLCVCAPPCVPVAEICDLKDNDCDGKIDEEASDMATWYLDSDGDDHGHPDYTVRSCTPPSGYVEDGDDCNDDLDTIHPGHEEICDGQNNDCDDTTADGVDECLNGCDSAAQVCL